MNHPRPNENPPRWKKKNEGKPLKKEGRGGRKGKRKVVECYPISQNDEPGV